MSLQLQAQAQAQTSTIWSINSDSSPSTSLSTGPMVISRKPSIASSFASAKTLVSKSRKVSFNQSSPLLVSHISLGGYHGTTGLQNHNLYGSNSNGNSLNMNMNMTEESNFNLNLSSSRRKSSTSTITTSFLPPSDEISSDKRKKRESMKLPMMAPPPTSPRSPTRSTRSNRINNDQWENTNSRPNRPPSLRIFSKADLENPQQNKRASVQSILDNNREQPIPRIPISPRTSSLAPPQIYIPKRSSSTPSSLNPTPNHSPYPPSSPSVYSDQQSWFEPFTDPDDQVDPVEYQAVHALEELSANIIEELYPTESNTSSQPMTRSSSSNTRGDSTLGSEETGESRGGTETAPRCDSVRSWREARKKKLRQKDLAGHRTAPAPPNDDMTIRTDGEAPPIPLRSPLRSLAASPLVSSNTSFVTVTSEDTGRGIPVPLVFSPEPSRPGQDYPPETPTPDDILITPVYHTSMPISSPHIHSARDDYYQAITPTSSVTSNNPITLPPQVKLSKRLGIKRSSANTGTFARFLPLRDTRSVSQPLPNSSHRRNLSAEAATLVKHQHQHYTLPKSSSSSGRNKFRLSARIEPPADPRLARAHQEAHGGGDGMTALSFLAMESMSMGREDHEYTPKTPRPPRSPDTHMYVKRSPTAVRHNRKTSTSSGPGSPIRKRNSHGRRASRTYGSISSGSPPISPGVGHILPPKELSRIGESNHTARKRSSIASMGLPSPTRVRAGQRIIPVVSIVRETRTSISFATALSPPPRKKGASSAPVSAVTNSGSNSNGDMRDGGKLGRSDSTPSHRDTMGPGIPEESLPGTDTPESRASSTRRNSFGQESRPATPARLSFGCTEPHQLASLAQALYENGRSNAGVQDDTQTPAMSRPSTPSLQDHSKSDTLEINNESHNSLETTPKPPRLPRASSNIVLADPILSEPTSSTTPDPSPPLIHRPRLGSLSSIHSQSSIASRRRGIYGVPTPENVLSLDTTLANMFPTPPVPGQAQFPPREMYMLEHVFPTSSPSSHPWVKDGMNTAGSIHSFSSHTNIPASSSKTSLHSFTQSQSHSHSHSHSNSLSRITSQAKSKSQIHGPVPVSGLGSGSASGPGSPRPPPRGTNFSSTQAAYAQTPTPTQDWQLGTPASISSFSTGFSTPLPLPGDSEFVVEGVMMDENTVQRKKAIADWLASPVKRVNTPRDRDRDRDGKAEVSSLRLGSSASSLL